MTKYTNSEYYSTFAVNMTRDNEKGKRISKESGGRGKGKGKDKGNEKGKRKEKGKGSRTSSRATMRIPSRATERIPSLGSSPLSTSTPSRQRNSRTLHVIRRPKPRSHSQGDACKNYPIRPTQVDIHGGQ